MKHTQLSFFNLNSYHNTITETDNVELDKREAQCRKQEELVLSVFQIAKYKDFTAYEMWIAVGQQWPKASIQRAITNLCNDNNGSIVFSGAKRKGEFNVKTNCWKLK
jgi:hypothetical protein